MRKMRMRMVKMQMKRLMLEYSLSRFFSVSCKRVSVGSGLEMSTSSEAVRSSGNLSTGPEVGDNVNTYNRIIS